MNSSAPPFFLMDPVLQHIYLYSRTTRIWYSVPYFTLEQLWFSVWALHGFWKGSNGRWWGRGGLHANIRFLRISLPLWSGNEFFFIILTVKIVRQITKKPLLGFFPSFCWRGGGAPIALLRPNCKSTNFARKRWEAPIFYISEIAFPWPIYEIISLQRPLGPSKKVIWPETNLNVPFPPFPPLPFRSCFNSKLFFFCEANSFISN